MNGIAHHDDADTVTYAMHVVPDDIQLSFHVHVEVASNGARLPFTSTDVAGTARATGRRRSRPTRSDPVATA